MSEIMDNIVNCNISIESPVEDAASFGTVMIIGDGPLKGGKDLKSVDKYASLAEVKDAGWKENTAVYKAARAAFLQDPKPELIYIAVRQEVTGTSDDTKDDAEDLEEIDSEEILLKNREPFLATVKRVIGMAGWYGLALVEAEESDYDAVAQIIETTEKIFAFSTQSKKNPLPRNDYLRTFGIYSENVDEYAHVAWLAKCFSYDPGSETWAYKTLAGVSVSELSTREMRNLEEECRLNYYVECASKKITCVGKMIGGEWIDIIRFRDWLKNQMQLRIFELFVKNPKIPYLDTGITLVENQMRAALQEGQKAGGIAETEFVNDEPVEGYTVTVPRAASLSSAQRSSRTLKDCKFTARLSGAIHIVELKGNLVY